MIDYFDLFRQITPDTLVQIAAVMVAVTTFVIAQWAEGKRDREVANREIYQRLELASNDLFRFEAQNPDLIRPLWEEGAVTPKEGTAEHMVAMNYVSQILNLFEMAIRFRKENVLNPEIFGTWVAWFWSVASAPGFKWYWSCSRTDYLPTIRQVMDKGLELATSPLPEEEARRSFYAQIAEIFDCPDIRGWDRGHHSEKAVSEQKTATRPEPLLADHQVAIGWVNDEQAAVELAELFVREADNSYISHSEVHEGRAIDPQHWSPQLPELLRREFIEATREGSPLRLLGLRVDGRWEGLALLSFHEEAEKYASLDDILVSRIYRNAGFASKMMEEINKMLRAEAYHVVYAESNRHNSRAHAFLERVGFEQISGVFRMTL